MSYADEITAARRLAILLVLYFEPGYTANLHFLRERVGKTGYVTSLDLMETELAWLREQGLIETLGGGYSGSYRLLARGEDVALGRSQTPGVRRPSPGEINGPR